MNDAATYTAGLAGLAGALGTGVVVLRRPGAYQPAGHAIAGCRPGRPAAPGAPARAGRADRTGDAGTARRAVPRPGRAATRPYAAPPGPLAAVRPGQEPGRPAAPRPAGAVPAGGRVRRGQPGRRDAAAGVPDARPATAGPRGPAQPVRGRRADAGCGHRVGVRHRRRTGTARGAGGALRLRRRQLRRPRLAGRPTGPGPGDQRAVDPPVRLGRPGTDHGRGTPPAARPGPLGPRGRPGGTHRGPAPRHPPGPPGDLDRTGRGRGGRDRRQ